MAPQVKTYLNRGHEKDHTNPAAEVWAGGGEVRTDSAEASEAE